MLKRPFFTPALNRTLNACLSLTLALSMTLAALAEGYKINDRVLAPYGGDMAAATIVAGPNSRGEWRIHYDNTDSQRDKWIRPDKLAPFTDLGALSPGQVLQADILSAWNWVEVIEVKGEEVLVRKLHSTSETDQWIAKGKLRRAPEGQQPAAWNHPYRNGEFVRYLKGSEQAIGRFSVQGDNLYVGDYRITDIKQILGVWTPRYKVGEQLRQRRAQGVWEKVRVDGFEPGGTFNVTLLRTGQKDIVNEVTLAEEWDYDGFYAIAAPLFDDQFALKMGWLMAISDGTMSSFTIDDATLKTGMARLSEIEAKLKAKYSKVPGDKSCNECPAKVMDILARRKQVLMKAAGMDVNTFLTNQIGGYERKFDDARKGTLWNLPLSFGAVDVAAAVQQELRQNEADLAGSIARNKLIDPAYVFKYDRAPIVQAITKASAELPTLLRPYGQISDDMGQYSAHDATAEALATRYVRAMDPQATILGAATLQGGWTKDTSIDINTARTQAKISTYLSTKVVVRTTSPKYKYPVAYAMTLYNEGKGLYVMETSVVRAFYKP